MKNDYTRCYFWEKKNQDNTTHCRDNQDMLGLNIDTLDEIILKDLKTMLNKSIQCLTPEERYIIYGLYFKSKTQIQISCELDLPEYAVSRKKKRALQKLKK